MISSVGNDDSFSTRGKYIFININTFICKEICITSVCSVNLHGCRLAFRREDAKDFMLMVDTVLRVRDHHDIALCLSMEGEIDEQRTLTEPLAL